MSQTLLMTVEIRSRGPEWELEVVNTLTGKRFVSTTLDAMNETIRMLYGLYEGYELRVEWLKSPLARPDHISEIRTMIAAMQQELDRG